MLWRDRGCVLHARRAACCHCTPSCWMLQRAGGADSWGTAGGGAGCLRLWVGAVPALFLGVEIPNHCCLWLLQAGCPCSNPQRLPPACARGPLSFISPECAHRWQALSHGVVSPVSYHAVGLSSPSASHLHPSLAVSRGEAVPRIASRCLLDGTRRKILRALFRRQVFLFVSPRFADRNGCIKNKW